MIKISEIFYSIQGEGERVGSPSVFVRVGLCNFSCKGFGEEVFYKGQKILGCDSIYAANAKFHQEWMDFDNPQKLIEAIKEQAQGKFDIVLTGGEPSLYFANPVLLETLQYFIQKGHAIYVESNASIFFDFNAILKELHFTLSVKLSNSKEPKKKRIHIQAIQNILDHARSVNFKFVLHRDMCEEGILEIKEILSCIQGHYKVFLMPQGSDIKSIDANIQALLPLCLEHGFSLCDRLHIRIWGNKRGV